MPLFSYPFVFTNQPFEALDLLSYILLELCLNESR